jgi:hypothetical protein
LSNLIGVGPTFSCLRLTGFSIRESLIFIED